MDQSTDAIVDTGVDYITATHLGRPNDSSLAAFGRFICDEQISKGERVRNFYFSGYRGRTAGSCAYGVRHDGAILRLSGPVAKEYWHQALHLATNITRLDVQATVRPSDGPTGRLVRHHDEILTRQRGRGRPAKFKFWYGPSGAEAAILGRRSSDWFGRAYDKGLECGLPEFQGTLRYEAETKRKVALALAQGLDQTNSSTALILSTVSRFFSVRGCRLPAWDSQPSETTRPPESFPEVRRLDQVSIPEATIKLGTGRARRSSLWLYNAVRPTVQNLIAQGHRELVLQLLGLSDENEVDQMSPKGLDPDFERWR